MMKQAAISFSGPFLPVLRRAGCVARARGLTAYVVGGFVRDRLLNKKSLDCDIVVEGDALAFARQLKKELSVKSLTAYPAFGTATLRLADGRVLDLATARRETYARPGALPTVCPGTIQEDLFRRDITINALAVSISPKTFGQLWDPYGGRDDLKHKRIRVLHSRSFQDDPTRILRGVRYEQRFGFRLERRSLKLMKDALSGGSVATVRPARYFTEFRRVWGEPDPGAVLRRLARLGGLDFLGEAFVLDARLLSRVEKGLTRPLLSGPDLISTRTGVFLLVLAGSCSEAQRTGWARRFHLTRAERGWLKALPRAAGVKESLSRPGLRPSQVCEMLDSLPLEIICFIRAQCSGKILSSYLDGYLLHSRWVRLEISGKDLWGLGCPPGRVMGRVLNELLACKQDGGIQTRREEFACARELLRKG